MLGLGLGDVVEATAKKLGLPAPKMSAAQMALTKTRAIGLFSSSLGISIGCIMGMVPLLFFEDDWTKEMREVFRALDVDGNGCEQYTHTRKWTGLLRSLTRPLLGVVRKCDGTVCSQDACELRVGAAVREARRAKPCGRSRAGVCSAR